MSQLARLTKRTTSRPASRPAAAVASRCASLKYAGTWRSACTECTWATGLAPTDFWQDQDLAGHLL